MSGLPTSTGTGTCQFCGMAVSIPHETQAACIAALHAEIGRTRDVLASLRPTAVPGEAAEDGDHPSSIRLGHSDHDSR